MPSPQRDEPAGLPRFLLWPAEALVALYVVANAVALPLFRPLLRWLARLRLVPHLEALFAHLPPYVILALLLVPFLTAEPAKVFALYLMGTGHLIAGAIVFVAAYFVSLVLVEQVYQAGKSRLRSIAWFARLTDWLFDLRDRLLGWMESTAAWIAVTRLKRRIGGTILRWRRNTAAAVASLRAWAAATARKRRA